MEIKKPRKEEKFKEKYTYIVKYTLAYKTQEEYTPL